MVALSSRGHEVNTVPTLPISIVEESHVEIGFLASLRGKILINIPFNSALQHHRYYSQTNPLLLPP
jgi:hypothetical protein